MGNFIKHLKLQGRQGKHVLVNEENILIIKEKKSFSPYQENLIPIQKIISVEVKKPGIFSTGFIYFYTTSNAEINYYKTIKNDFDVTTNENSVVFTGSENFQIALKIKQRVESESLSCAIQSIAIAAANGITKLKSMLDSGAMTQIEFESKRKQLLHVLIENFPIHHYPYSEADLL